MEYETTYKCERWFGGVADDSRYCGLRCALCMCDWHVDDRCIDRGYFRSYRGYWALEPRSDDRGTVAGRHIATPTIVDYKENPTSRTEVFEMISRTSRWITALLKCDVVL